MQQTLTLHVSYLLLLSVLLRKGSKWCVKDMSAAARAKAKAKAKAQGRTKRNFSEHSFKICQMSDLFDAARALRRISREKGVEMSFED